MTQTKWPPPNPARFIGPNPPLPIDVLGGSAHPTIPKAIWLSRAGTGGHFQDEVQDKLASIHASITGGDLSQPLVFFCQGPQCWLSYNAALRFENLGYQNVFWYRGGLKAWKQAGLPTKTSVKYTP